MYKKGGPLNLLTWLKGGYLKNMGAISGGLQKIWNKKQFLLHSPLQLKLWLVPYSGFPLSSKTFLNSNVTRNGSEESLRGFASSRSLFISIFIYLFIFISVRLSVGHKVIGRGSINFVESIP